MEGRILHQTVKEGRPKQLSKLQRDHSIVCTRKSFQQDPTEQDEGWRWLPTPRSARKLLKESITHRPDCNYEKAFDSINKGSLWKLLIHYGMPEKLTSIIRNPYEGFFYRVVHWNQLTDTFLVKTGVRQRCMLPSFLFLQAIDWVMKISTNRMAYSGHSELSSMTWTLWTT
jgi:hypothetical protein